MSKGLVALETIIQYNDLRNPVRGQMYLINIIEKELKRLEKIDDKKVVYMTSTQGQAQKVIDELSKHKEVVITNLSDQKKLKALEIIKEKKVNVGLLLRCATVERYNKGICYEPRHLIQEEFDLLKEVLL